jgi:hypothetical protein
MPFTPSAISTQEHADDAYEMAIAEGIIKDLLALPQVIRSPERSRTKYELHERPHPDLPESRYAGWLCSPLMDSHPFSEPMKDAAGIFAEASGWLGFAAGDCSMLVQTYAGS